MLPKPGLFMLLRSMSAENYRLRSMSAENYRSLRSIRMDLGQVNLFVGR